MHGDLPSTMQSPVKGMVSDRPWGVTLGALGVEARTGQLTLRADGRAYRIVFLRGVIVGASSPLAADSAIRIALTSKSITPTQAADLKQRLKSRPRRSTNRADTHPPEPDEVDLIAAELRWTPAQADELRNAVITRCAARTFAIDHGNYVLEDRILHTGVEGSVDVRSAVYLGARMHLSQQRLALDLRQLGSWFVLKPGIVDDLSAFGFSETEVPILEALRGGANPASIEARRREIDPRMVQAVIYALAACDAVVCSEPPAMTTTAAVATPTAPAISRVPTPREPTVTRVPTPRDPTFSRVPTPREPTLSRVPTRRPPTFTEDDTKPWKHATFASGSSPRRNPTAAAPVVTPTPTSRPAAITESFVELHPTTVRPNALTVNQVKALIVARATLLDHGADHFTILGLPPGASPDEVRAAYIELARYLEPKRLAELGIGDDSYTARRLFAQICIAVTTLTDPDRRRQYVNRLRGS